MNPGDKILMRPLPGEGGPMVPAKVIAVHPIEGVNSPNVIEAEDEDGERWFLEPHDFEPVES